MQSACRQKKVAEVNAGQNESGRREVGRTTPARAREPQLASSPWRQLAGWFFQLPHLGQLLSCDAGDRVAVRVVTGERLLRAVIGR